MTAITIIFISCFVLLFIIMCFIAQTERDKARERMRTEAQGSFREVTLAAAGGKDGCHSSAKKINVAAEKIDLIQYKDAQGNILTSDKYKRFIVDGNSMRLCGIYHNDLIFATRGIVLDDNTQFPIILVIQKNEITPDFPDYKIRRTWRKTRFIDDKTLLEEVSNILQSDAFQRVRNLPEYPGDDAILEDFENTRLTQYKDDFIDCDNPNEVDKEIILSTTLDTSDNDRIHFSIHPYNKVFGKVVASFKLNEDEIKSLNSNS